MSPSETCHYCGRSVEYEDCCQYCGVCYCGNCGIEGNRQCGCCESEADEVDE